MKITNRLIISFVALFFLCSCVPFSTRSNEKMYELGSALTKLTAAIEATVRYKDIPEAISDEELIEKSVEHDKSLLSPFKNYKLHVLRQDRHAIVLLCTGDGKYGLLEDAGCTYGLDKHLWLISPTQPCEFTLTVERICEDK